jgi:hypothetical protein
MAASRSHRLVLLAILLTVLLILCVGYATLTANPNHGRYPGVEEIVHDDRLYRGQHVVVDGMVTATEPTVIEAAYETVVDGRVRANTVRFTVTNTPSDVTAGDRLQVYGELTGDRTVRATTVTTVPGRNLPIMYLVSFLVGLWVLARLVRHWRLNPTYLSFHHRATATTCNPLTTPADTHHDHQGGDGDA